jgi:hypothetical protein
VALNGLLAGNKDMKIRKHGEMGIFFYYYYYWYFGQVCPWLEREVR